MPKYGSKSAWILVDGYDLTASKVKQLRAKVASLMERTDGLGDSWEESTPVGLSKAELAVEGGFFDTATNASHEALSASVPSGPTATARVVCFGVAGHTFGERFTGFAGVFSVAYQVLAQLGNLTKANADYVVSGRRDAGIILHPLGAETADESGTSHDNAAGSSNGGAAYLEVTAFDGLTDAVVKVQHSTDNSSWSDLVTFTTVADRTAERVTVNGTVNRYLRYDLNVTGTGSLTLFVGFARY